ncbi:MAG: hypothetical protein KDK70_06495 [Myxococcales bacterium]|nr:hypothetical protein [Myxococcales bacterium]
MLAVGCYSGVEGVDFEAAEVELDPEVEETIENLKAAGFPESEIEVLEDGTVFVGSDAVVSLEASREMAGIRRVASDLEDEDDFRQYRTNNLVSSSVTKICIVPSASFNGNATLSAGLDQAIANYNGQGLSFTMQRNGTGCSATITANTDNSGGGSAGFPSGGLPYNTINIGTSVASYGVSVAKHVISHELGHCVGFRHSDYYNRSISCGGAATNEGTAGVGAVLIPGTPGTAVANGSVMNSCYNSGSTGVWTASDVTALQELYAGGGAPPPPPPPPPAGDSCAGHCGANAGSCWCDSACTNYGDCCSDKAFLCDAGPSSCVGKCNQNAGQCWCDAACTTYGDCCSNKTAVCG